MDLQTFMTRTMDQNSFTTFVGKTSVKQTFFSYCLFLVLIIAESNKVLTFDLQLPVICCFTSCCRCTFCLLTLCLFVFFLPVFHTSPFKLTCYIICLSHVYHMLIMCFSYLSHVCHVFMFLPHVHYVFIMCL